ncbi:NAD(P)-binding protein [Lepidopterella palustris CBS 459.81]|uniref:NAD(P)-binding protein n=1 Tax=Lepidopterella palustris CBS 459.81 TaxID=1314670 RepID=A0A8E2E2R5_9PEZI|nr:NAD(P)-binding protein [Lepidopterella palustris CBS 459.81]
MSTHRVLLTGANGFVGSHILSQLLSAKHSVRAVVRSQSKVDAVRADFPSFSNLDFAIVPDMTTSGAFDKALESTPPFDTVIHTASPFLYRAISSNHEFLDPAIMGTTEILKGVQSVASGSVKRVIITSSFAAVGAFGQVPDANKVYTSADWNPTTLDQALTTEDLGIGYRASKKFAEKAAWDFIETEKPNFDLVVLNPPMIYGPLRHSVPKIEDLNESTMRIWNLFLKPENTPKTEMPPNGLHLYVDVRDIAKAHLLAMTTPSAGNTRFLVTAGTVTSQQIADILRSELPETLSRTPKGVPGSNGLPETAFTADASPAEKVLGMRWTPMKETFAELGKQLLEIEKAQA